MQGNISLSRRSIRLRKYDYSQAGCYFFTSCVTNRKSIFGHIIGDKMECNRAGEAVWNVWRELPVRFPIVDLDAFVVMPNHVHGILLLCPPKTGGRASPAPTNAIVNAGRRGDPWVARRDSPNRAHHRGHFGDIIGAFKSLSAVAVNGVLHQTGSIWQRNYYEHVVRNGEDLDAIRLYIDQNPAQWLNDRDNPESLS